LDALGQLLGPWKYLTSPKIVGGENLPDPRSGRPVLFVGNHTLFGLYDLPIILHELYLRGFKARGLAHPGHWKGPMGAVFERFGAVKASPFTAYKLLAAGESVLLFPGGAKEVTKRKDEKYQLLWSEKTDFVRMASKLGAVIVPFAAVGGDDAFEVAYDKDDILQSPAGDLIVDAITQADMGMDVKDVLYPITKLPGIGLPSVVPIPSLERIYIKFQPSIDCQEACVDVRDASQCSNLYRQVQEAIEDGLQEMQAQQAEDPSRDLSDRIITDVAQFLPRSSEP
ncbi:hypothetical protein CYMTET_55493, partial [Cymbomonas tetramitiformis]